MFEPIRPEWPAPDGVEALTTTRGGGASGGAWSTLNLADHVGDDVAAVAENRRRLRRLAALPTEPCWLEQVHGTSVVEAGERLDRPPSADAAWTARAGVVCAVLTADCLPVLFCDRAGSRVAAAHAGWRGLVGGVLEATVAALQVPGAQLLAWLGPAIGPASFEVGAEVREAFVADDPAAAGCFVAGRDGRWHADLYALARLRLAALGVTAVYGGGLDTVAEAQRLYSYRRDRVTGRMATLIWRRPQ